MSQTKWIPWINAQCRRGWGAAYALKKRTTRTIYWRHIGHSLSTLPQLVHVAIWPHSSSTHSIAASIHILHRSTDASFSTAARVYQKKKRREKRKSLELKASRKIYTKSAFFYSRKIPGQLWRSSHKRCTRSNSSLFSQQPLKSTRFSINTSFNCFTLNSSKSSLCTSNNIKTN